ncbi:hypothetical protein AAFX91_02025 [Bradyrhizobium sp. 31Argb]|uniref:hypothetical protein n=1 Tax=unclassified Bradyrhizobium TaxID=2631580 RepID=UPI00249F11BB|nr:hypothetical protein [Bradyrhizobium sp. Arg237L]MDI4231495.1 hypothetical protein [Bradyrhizobium sp. Arg237L]
MREGRKATAGGVPFNSFAEYAPEPNPEGREISEVLREFIESHSGRPNGVQLALPLRM